jgi:hypothetical protein
MLESPSLKRLKLPKFAKIVSRSSPTRQKHKSTPSKPQSFKQILNKWEDMSTTVLTPAIKMKPRSTYFVDSQPDRVLENTDKKLKILGQPSKI